MELDRDTSRAVLKRINSSKRGDGGVVVQGVVIQPADALIEEIVQAMRDKSRAPHVSPVCEDVLQDVLHDCSDVAQNAFPPEMVDVHMQENDDDRAIDCTRARQIPNKSVPLTSASTPILPRQFPLDLTSIWYINA